MMIIIIKKSKAAIRMNKQDMMLPPVFVTPTAVAQLPSIRVPGLYLTDKI